MGQVCTTVTTFNLTWTQFLKRIVVQHVILNCSAFSWADLIFWYVLISKQSAGQRVVVTVISTVNHCH